MNKSYIYYVVSLSSLAREGSRSTNEGSRMANKGFGSISERSMAACEGSKMLARDLILGY